MRRIWSALIGSRHAGWRKSDHAQCAVTLLTVFAVWLMALSRWYLNDSVVPWDSKNQFYAFFRFLAESIHAGTSIFWNPYHYGGHPSVADPQSLVFSPPFLLWAYFDRTPSLRSFDLIVQLHLLAGGLATAGVGLRRGWPPAACILAAAVFMLGGAASARLNHTGIIICYGLFPLALLTLEIALQRRSMGMALIFTLIAANIMLGRNQVSLMLCLLLLGFGFRELLSAPAPLVWLRERVWVLALIVIVGFALTAVPILLTLQLATLSNRPAVELADALQGSLHPANLASALVADVFGAHAQSIYYWGPQWSLTPDVASTDTSFNYLFVGAAPVILLLWLGFSCGRCAVRGSRTLAAMLLIALMFSLGRYTPLFSLVFDYVPGFAYFRRPVDSNFILAILISLLSGQLLADYVRAGIPGARALPVALIVSAGVGIAVSVLTISAMTDNQMLSLLAVAKSAPPIAAVGVVLFIFRHSRHRSAAAAGIALVGCAELVAWNAASRLNAENIRIYQVLETTAPEDAVALRVLGAELERRHAEGARPRVEVLGLSGPWQNLAVIRKIEATTGYNPLRIGIYDRYVSPGEIGWVAAARQFPASFDGYDCALARALGLEYVVLDRPIEDLKQARRPSGMEVLLAGPRVWIYRIPGAMPRVRFSSRIRVADLDATLSSGELVHPPQPDQIAVDTDTPTIGPIWRASMSSEASSASIVSWRPGQIVIDVNASGAGVLVLHDTYYPGWVAEVDGVPTPILRADVLFRGVEVPAGRHTVVFRFRPLTIENLSRAVHDVLAPRPVEAPPGSADWQININDQH